MALAASRRNGDMGDMRVAFLPMAVCIAVATANPAMAQIPPAPGTSPVIPFPTAPPPLPPPRIEIPVVPQMNSPPRFELQNTTPSRVEQNAPPKQILKRQRRDSFGDRMARCLDEGAALGLGPNERAAYSRSCANQ